MEQGVTINGIPVKLYRAVVICDGIAGGQVVTGPAGKATSTTSSSANTADQPCSRTSSIPNITP